MKLASASAVVLILLEMVVWSSAAGIRLNEVVSSNGATIADENGDYSDWIELSNEGDAPVDLAGWGLSDQPTTPFKWVFPQRFIAPGEYLIIWASDKNRANPTGPLHTNFAVSAGGETLVVTDPFGTTVDSLAVPALPRDTSYGHKPGHGDSGFYFEIPTPGAANTTAGYPDLMTPPVFSHVAGLSTTPFTLDLATTAGWTVYYTLDGSDPDPTRVGKGAQPYRITQVYGSSIPIASRSGQANVFSQIPTTGIVPTWLPTWRAPTGEVFKATIVRARAHDPATGRLSKTVTRTFFVDPNIQGRYGQLPVISVVSDYNNLFADATGIYVPGKSYAGNFDLQNFMLDWKRPASIEYFASDGAVGFAGDYEIGNQGSSSPASPQKALSVTSRAELGSESIPYPLFAGAESPANRLTTCNRFILRAWGSALNWPVFFSDAYHQTLAATADLEIQDYRPAIVFINGEYWGLHEIREQDKNSWYFQEHTGINRNNPGFDLISEDGAEEGDSVHWDATMAYVNSNNMANDAAYDYASTRIDVADFARYIVHCVYAGKRDWPGQNELKWRPRTAEGKWRWAQRDMDHGLNAYGAPEYDMLVQVLLGGSEGYGPHPLLVKLLQNARFKSMFINTYADWLNSRVLSSVELARFDAMKAALAPFIAEYDSRWPNMHAWDGTAYGREILLRRNGVRRTQLRNAFALGGDRLVTLQTDATQGVIRCNSLVVDRNTPGASTPAYPWSGTYFQNQPVTLEALPREGYRFVGWQVKVNGVILPPLDSDGAYYSQQTAIILNLTEPAEAEAAFALVPRATLHVWDFNNLLDPLPPTFTLGGGMLGVTPPAIDTSVSPASQGFDTAHLRVNYPLGKIVEWRLPTPGFQALKLAYLTRRSGSGAGTQTVSYTADGTTWTLLESYPVADANPQPKSFDFSGIATVSDNPNFAVRVEFALGGGGSVGNNRFDAVVLSGVRTRTLVVDSALATGVHVSASPPDNSGLTDGVTGFSCRYPDATVVTLTAPAVSNWERFQQWRKDGVDLGASPSINVAMDSDHKLTAVYVASAPVITVDLADLGSRLGDAATFRVTAGGSGTLSYQWRFNGADIPGARTDTLTLPSVLVENAGTYDVVVSNAVGSVTSRSALLEIVTLVNGSFEADFSGWTASGNLWIEWETPYLATAGRSLVAFNGGQTTPNGVLAQTFATTPGQAFTLTFDAGVLAYNTYAQRLLVTLTGTSSLLSQTITLTGLGRGATRWLPQSFTFVANSAATTLTFRDQSTTTTNLDLLLDNVRVAAVVIPPNTAPVAVAEAYSTYQATPLLVAVPGVLANDSDAQANPLTAVLDSGPSHGVLTLNANGGFTYTPAAGFTGSDAFTYHANDGSLNSNIVTVGLAVNALAPGILVNGSFEADFTGWTTSGNLWIEWDTPYAASVGSKLVVFNGGQTTPNGVLTQTFATTPGQSYTLTFDAGVLAYNKNAQKMQVTLTGKHSLLSKSLTLSGVGGGATRWLPQSFAFVADSATALLSFRDQSTTTNNLDLLLDNVRVITAASLAAAVSTPGATTGKVLTQVLPQALIQPSGLIGIPELSGTLGAMTIRMTAPQTGSYILERSPDLNTWQYVGEIPCAAQQCMEFHDTQEPPSAERPKPALFYRIGMRPTSNAE